MGLIICSWCRLIEITEKALFNLCGSGMSEDLIISSSIGILFCLESKVPRINPSHML